MVRQVVNVLSGKIHKSLYSLYAIRSDKPAPVCGKGTVDKIKKLYDEGKLQPFLDYLSNSLTISEAKADQEKEAEPDVPKESRTKQVPYEETPHKQKMRELAGEVAKRVKLPLAFCRFIQERKPGFWPIGDGFLVYINETGDAELVLDFEGHLYEGLFNHFLTGGFSDVVSNIDDWKEKTGKIMIESHELLNEIKTDIEKDYNISLLTCYAEETGFTTYFLESIYGSVILGIKGTGLSGYDLDVHNLSYYGCLICSGLPTEDLESCRDTHIKLIEKYMVTDQAKQVGEKVKNIKEIETNIQQRLERFIDMERVPGWCELCE